MKAALDGAPVAPNTTRPLTPDGTPTPISTPAPFNYSVTVAGASNSYQNMVAANVLTDDAGTFWNSGGNAPQSLTFDFGQTVSLYSASLVVAQNPACPTRHEFYGGLDPSHLMYVGSIEGPTQNGQTISIQFANRPPQLRYLQVLTTQSCSWVAWGKIRFSAGAPRTSEPPLFVGYYGSAFGDDYLDEIRDQTNTLWMTSENAMTYLSRMQLYGSMHAMMSVSGLFFDGSFNLLPNYAENWAAFVAKISPYADILSAFYPLDEPFMNGNNHQIPMETMKKNLEAVNALIKSTFPAKPIAVIFSAQELLNSAGAGDLVIPAGYDWVGYDCYGLWLNCHGHTIPQFNDLMKSKMRPGQRLMVIADSVLLGISTSSLKFVPEEILLKDRIQKDYEYFLSEPLAVAFFPFIWWSSPGADGMTGTRDLPLVLPKTKSYMKAILDRNTSVSH